MPQGHSSAYYDAIKQRFADERSVRVGARPAGFVQYAALAVDEAGINDPHRPPPIERNAVTETVDVAIVGGGFSGLMVAARLLAKGSHRVRIIERGADFGGTWYWNRYPGAACDSVSFDYMPMLDQMGYVPSKHYAGGDEIFGYARAMGARYALYDRALFQTTVTSTTWDPAARRWRVCTDRGDVIAARFVVCANGSMAKPKLARIEGMERFRGDAFHTSRWDYEYTGRDLEKLADKRVGIIGTGASAIQVVPNLGVGWPPSSNACAPRSDRRWAATPPFASGSHGLRTRSTPTTPRPGTWPRSCGTTTGRRGRGPCLRRTTTSTTRTTRDRQPRAATWRRAHAWNG